ncbi:hypothetical protein [Tahibacter harae]|uniref:Uncharacterized protein n=1 Tax=Tahibacter harae TaxID=2963937 RepID=A0ABT1QRY9_9GAMM|nr:hypothetical protein [Tahibacter harae]MCQ4165065.1 hypothetical protein [Tahibacter harae]
MAIHYQTINLRDLSEWANTGIRRAAMFMGLGINAALDPEFRKYQLTQVSRLQVIDPNLAEDRIAGAKQQFKIWIEAAGFRELAETYTSFLDQVFVALQMILASRVQDDVPLIKKRCDKFTKISLKEKLDKIGAIVGTPSKYSVYLLSLQSARNCLVHRMGRVGVEDLDDQGELVVSWLGPDPGSAQTVPGLLKNAATLTVVERKIVFRKGDQMMLSAAQIAEICIFYQQAANETCAGIGTYSVANGVQSSWIDSGSCPTSIHTE